MTSLLWTLHNGGQWRTLPSDYSKWNSIFKRFSRWCRKGVWANWRRAFIDQPDLQSVFIDSTIVRSHACAAGAADSSAEQEALSFSRGEFSAKIHAITDGPGNPLEFVLTDGQDSDIG